ncbi:glycosyltransferase family 2 protein [Vibrio metschnikovii]|uniref:glycosyltransferase family 2 protein n=1 Tax=Vibrio metschnikovii TaxID=28172 RepID=UPI001C30C49E|nr:glycosyltransferase family 2 protein [Vibrio metschnikovii]MDA3139740.1 glycosyltransferase family 2 protein [Vibrio metschnikovii]
MSIMVSVIMPSYNSEKTISESIKSVLKQSYTNWELIIVDDQSSDDTWSIISKYAEEFDNIHIYRNKTNSGAGVSRNFAIEKSKGRFVAFLDSDDLWSKNKLSKQITFMLDNNYPFTYTYYHRFDKYGDRGVVEAPKYTTYDKLLYSNVIGCLTAIYDTHVLGKKYMPLIRKRQDMGLWLDILKVVPRAYCLPEVLASYRMDSGMTANKLTVLSYQWTFYREIVGLSLFRCTVTFSIYALKGFLKHRK